MRSQALALSTALLATCALVGSAAAGGRFGGHGPHGDPGRLLDEHADALGLDEQTLEDLEQLFAASREQVGPIRDELHDEREHLHQLVSGADPDLDAVMDKLEEIGALETELRQLHLGTWLTARALLTPEQHALLRELREDRRERRHSRRHGPDFEE